MKAWNKVKITVVKKFVAEDLIKEFVEDEEKNRFLGSCDRFKLEQNFILEKPNKPDEFCSWAWADIHRDLIAMMGGADFPWINREGVAVACCTDGLRPVVFKIERI